MQRVDGNGGPFVVVVLLFTLLTIALAAVLYWRIAGKTGYPSALGLLMLVPLANVVLLVVLAFTEWPIEAELRRLRGEGPRP